MKLRRMFGSLLLVVFATYVSAQDAVTLKFAEPKAGERIRVTEDEKANVITTVSVKGMAQPAKNERSTKTLVYVDECVTPPAEPGKKSLKLIRTYEKIEGSKDGKALDASLVGKAITIEKKGDKYTFTAGNDAVKGTLGELLDQSFNKSDGPGAKEMFPTTPVKPGEPWKLDPKKALAGLADDKFSFDPAKATIDGKLVKAYKKDGAGYGVIEVNTTLPITGLGPKNPLMVKPNSTMTLKLTGDGCIDGSTASGETVTKMKLVINAATMGVDVNVVADVDQVKKTEAISKK